jgi:BTB/POZ domain
MPQKDFLPGTEVIQIIVGEQEDGIATTWTAHKSVLIQFPYFEKYLRDGFSESEANCIKLPEEDAEVIRHILEYAYRTQVMEFKYDKDASIRSQEERDQLYMATQIYVTADKFCMEGLKNLIVDRFVAYHKMRFFYPPTIPMLRSIPGCKLREFLMRKLAKTVTTRGWQYMLERDSACKECDEFNGQEFQDMMLTISNLIRGNARDPADLPACEWHEHLSTTRCQAHGNEDFNKQAVHNGLEDDESGRNVYRRRIAHTP